MGLDTTAYEFIEHLPEYDENDDERATLVFTYPNFPFALEGMMGRDNLFDIGHGDNKYLGGEYYRGYGETNSTRSSYSGHSILRDYIATKFLGVSPEVVWFRPNDFKDKPFFELINFSDCEGVLGPVACKSLAEDFNNHPELDSGDSFYDDLYKDFARSFNLAANTGMVVFH